VGSRCSFCGIAEGPFLEVEACSRCRCAPLAGPPAAPIRQSCWRATTRGSGGPLEGCGYRVIPPHVLAGHAEAEHPGWVAGYELVRPYLTNTSASRSDRSSARRPDPTSRASVRACIWCPRWRAAARPAATLARAGRRRSGGHPPVGPATPSRAGRDLGTAADRRLRAALVMGGVFVADPALGFPPGTPEGTDLTPGPFSNHDTTPGAVAATTTNHHHPRRVGPRESRGPTPIPTRGQGEPTTHPLVAVHDGRQA
jgi:hypothetical protein